MRPNHYKGLGDKDIQPIDLIEAQKLGFHAGNVVKYVCRFTRKGGLDDLTKALWYLNRFIELEVNDDENPKSS